MQTKYHMPEDVRRSAIDMVRGYARRLRMYTEARYKILQGSACHFVDYTYTKTIQKKDGTAQQKKETRRFYFPSNSLVSDPTADKFSRLEALENHVEVRRMRAVEQAKLHIGLDMVKNERAKLTDAIWDSCISGRNFSYGIWNLSVGKTNFYERRNRFLWEIAEKTDFL